MKKLVLVFWLAIQIPYAYGMQPEALVEDEKSHELNFSESIENLFDKLALHEKKSVPTIHILPSTGKKPEHTAMYQAIPVCDQLKSYAVNFSFQANKVERDKKNNQHMLGPVGIKKQKKFSKDHLAVHVDVKTDKNKRQF